MLFIYYYLFAIFRTLYVDPLLSIFIACLIMISATPLIMSTAKIILQNVPESMKIDKLKEEVQSIEGIEDIHELHVFIFH